MTGKPDPAAVEFVNGLDLDEARGALQWLSGADPEAFKAVRRTVEDARRRRLERAEFRRSLREEAYPAVTPGTGTTVELGDVHGLSDLLKRHPFLSLLRS